MALDEALLEEAAAGGSATLRFYQWREPTLSLGYFQSHEDREAHAPSREVAMVRRLSGGGALMHDRELTYSISLPADHPLSRQSPRLYDVVHRSLIDLLASEGIVATLHRDRASALSAANSDEPTDKLAAAEEPFLCFARRTSVDVVLPTTVAAEQPVKIVGSAQRRRRGAVLQHGSVLLDRSPAAPELAGIEQISGVSISPAWLVERWSPALAAVLQLDLHDYQPRHGEDVMQRAEQLRAEKYAASAWTHRR